MIQCFCGLLRFGMSSRKADINFGVWVVEPKLAIFVVDYCILGCFIFSPFLILKMLGVVSDGVFDADFEYVIFILL